MGSANEALDLAAQPPAVILLAGLQGAGKTTSAAKLARLLKEREGKKVTVVSADVYRPAAISSSKPLLAEVGVDFFPSTAEQKPVDIVNAAREHAKIRFSDVLIVDTAGRLAVDEAMMAEIAALEKAVKPVETLFVVDAMTGQDAANTAKAFGEVLPLTGVILTKVDADSRGGAALSVRMVTGKPIKFLGVGEKTQALDPFHPDRLASRILGMGDMLSLIEEAEQKVDRKKAERIAQGQEGQEVRPRGPARPAPADEQHGRHGEHAGQNAGHGRHGTDGAGAGGQQVLRAYGGDDQFHDAARAAQPGPDPGLAETTHHAWLRYAGAGPQPSAQAAQADGENDEEDERRRDGKNDARTRRHDAAGGRRHAAHALAQ
jgi:Ni2+-binding GTPase involved in maturation of urease and hydrogenase